MSKEMSVQFIRGYWTAWRLLPISGKALLILGYVLSGILYWSSTIATPGSNVGCINGSCNVSPDQVQTTRFLGIGLLGMVSVFFVGALTAINLVMDKHPDKAAKLLGPRFDGVSTSNFWNRISPQAIQPVKGGLSKRMKLALGLLWAFNVFIWGYLLPAVNPDSFVFFLFAGAFVTLGSSLITLGTITPKWLDLA